MRHTIHDTQKGPFTRLRLWIRFTIARVTPKRPHSTSSISKLSLALSLGPFHFCTVRVYKNFVCDSLHHAPHIMYFVHLPDSLPCNLRSTARRRGDVIRAMTWMYLKVLFGVVLTPRNRSVFTTDMFPSTVAKMLYRRRHGRSFIYSSYKEKYWDRLYSVTRNLSQRRNSIRA